MKLLCDGTFITNIKTISWFLNGGICRVFIVDFIILSISIYLWHCNTYLYFCRLLVYHQTIADSWSSLVEWDEQLDWPNSQTWTEWCYTYASYFFIFHEHNSLPLGPIQPSSYSTYELHDLCNQWKEVRTLSAHSVSWTVREDKSFLS